MYKWSINLFPNQNPVYRHTYATWQYQVQVQTNSMVNKLRDGNPVGIGRWQGTASKAVLSVTWWCTEVLWTRTRSVKPSARYVNQLARRRPKCTSHKSSVMSAVANRAWVFKGIRTPNLVLGQPDTRLLRAELDSGSTCDSSSLERSMIIQL
jgi:hypothetical protein